MLFHSDALDFEEVLSTAPLLVLLDPGVARLCISIPILDDFIDEETESFQLMLEFGSPDDAVSVRLAQHITEVFILDNDGTEVKVHMQCSLRKSLEHRI